MLEHHLKTLLYQKECVVIPGFGAIICNFRSATLDHQSQEINPPSKTLAFNESLKTNDGVLADQIARNEDMNYPQALEAIRQEVNQWQDQLKKGHHLKLEAIGSFQRNDDGNLVFKPSRKKNYLLEAYGFDPVPIKPLPDQTLSVEDLPEPQPLKKVKPIRKPVASLIAAAGIVFAVFTISIVMYQNPGPSSARGNLAMMNHDKEHSKNQPVKTDPGKTTNNQKQPSKSESPDNESLNNGSESTKSHFFVITGSFKNPNNAKSYKAKWESQGYNATLIHNKEGWHRVGIGAFQDSLRMTQKLHKIKATTQPAAWVLQLNSENL